MITTFRHCHGCYSNDNVVLQAAVCTGDTDCGAGECCYIEPEFMVVSKRQLDLLPESSKRDTGTYKMLTSETRFIY